MLIMIFKALAGLGLFFILFIVKSNNGVFVEFYNFQFDHSKKPPGRTGKKNSV